MRAVRRTPSRTCRWQPTPRQTPRQSQAHKAVNPGARSTANARPGAAGRRSKSRIRRWWRPTRPSWWRTGPSWRRRRRIAQGESVIKCPPPLNVLKDAYDHSCCLALSDEYCHLMTDSPGARRRRGARRSSARRRARPRWRRAGRLAPLLRAVQLSSLAAVAAPLHHL